MTKKKIRATSVDGPGMQTRPASTHMGNMDEGMFDYEEINEPVTIGNGKDIWAKKRGKMRLMVLQKDGTSSDMTLHDYKFVPKLDCHAIRSIEIHRPRIQDKQ